jgi:O-methyltransferase
MKGFGRRANAMVPGLRIVRALQDVSSRWITQRSLAEVPGWLGKLHGIKVPRGATKNPVPAPYGSANINVLLALLDEVGDLAGDLAECGVYRGATLIPMGMYLKQRGLKKVIYGFDSFQGFDATVDTEIDLGGAADGQKRLGGFGDTSFEYVAAKVARIGLEQYVKIVKGYLTDTLACHSTVRFCFVHLDVDIYESYKVALQFFYPRLVSGGVILLDEYNDPPWPGCNKAVDEFLADKPERLQELERDNHVKYFIRRQ